MFTITAGDQPPAITRTVRQAAQALGELLLATLTPTRTRVRWQIDDETGTVLLGFIGLARPDDPEAVRAAVHTVVQETHHQLATHPDATEEHRPLPTRA